MSDTGDVEVEIEIFGEEANAIFYKGDRVYLYPVEDIEEVLDRLVPGWYTIYRQSLPIDEDDFYV